MQIVPLLVHVLVSSASAINAALRGPSALTLNATLAQPCQIPAGMRQVGTLAGFPMAVLGDDDIVSNHIAANGMWEIMSADEMVHASGGNLPAAGTFLDVGAHIGYYTLLFAKKGYQVLAVEPMTRNRAALKASICLNPELQSRITIVPSALVAPNEVGTRCVVRSTNRVYGETIEPCAHGAKCFNVGNGRLVCGAVIEPCAQGDPNCEEVPVNTLDAVLAASPPSNLQAAKFDVETYECKIFSGGQSLFRDYRPKFLRVETTWEKSQQCVAAEAQRHGYRTIPMGGDTLMAKRLQSLFVLDAEANATGPS